MRVSEVASGRIAALIAEELSAQGNPTEDCTDGESVFIKPGPGNRSGTPRINLKALAEKIILGGLNADFDLRAYGELT